MKHARRSTLFTLLFACIFVFGFSQTTMAAAIGTPADTTITNKATICYKVATVDQPCKDTPNRTFKVDRKLDLNVAEASASTTYVVPGQAAADYKCLGFDVTNEGNDMIDILLTVSQTSATNPFAPPADNFDATGLVIAVDNGDGICNAGDTATYLNNIASGNTQRVWVLGAIGGSQVTDDVAAVILTGQVATSAGTPGTAITTDDKATTDDKDTVQNVFADGQGDSDGDNDGKDSDTDSWTVQTASLTVTKSSVVYWDPINGLAGGGTEPKAIPGAVITYTISVTNGAGLPDATNVIISDDLTTEIVTNGTLAFETRYELAALTCAAGEGLYVNSVCESNAAGGNGDYGATAANTVTANLGTIAGGVTKTLKFQVKVQ